MEREEKVEKVQRLLTAYRKTKEMSEREPVTWELHPGTDIARRWTVVTSAYSGLEQTLKYLIAEEKAYTIRELVDLAGQINENADDKERKKYPYRTHNLKWLFSRLREPTQEVVREYFRRFQSLHSYIGIETVDQFLEEVSGPGGTGYERWRYTLIEDRQLPRNSPEALVAIWGTCVAIAEERVWELRRVRMPDEKLAWELSQELESFMLNVSIDRQNAGEPFQDIAPEIRAWLWKGGHPLNAFAEVLWSYSKYGSYGAANVSDWLSDTIKRWATNILTNPAVAGLTSLRAFVERAQGHMQKGASIRWNPKAKRFETVPWSLGIRFQRDLPQNASAIRDPTRQGIRVRALWKAAKESGYRILENREFAGPPDSDVWFCTLEVQAENEKGRVQSILSIWERPNEDHDRLYLVEECPREAMSQQVCVWVVAVCRERLVATWN